MPAHVTLDAAAAALLERNGYPAATVVSVDRDSILFTGPLDLPHTAWLDGGNVVLVQDGFVAEEPAGLHGF